MSKCTERFTRRDGRAFYSHTGIAGGLRQLINQQIHERLGFASDKGLVDYLMDDAPISDLMVCPGVEKLTIISGGKTVQDCSEMLGSLGMKNLVCDMKTRYPDRYVFFDVPPLLPAPIP